MKIIKADYLLTCNEEFEIIKNGAVVFDNKIIDYGEIDKIKEKYKNIEIKEYKNSVIMPSLINSHLHLEFSANKTTLRYGDFIDWLKSVIKYREELIENCEKECITQAIEDMKKSGIGTIGAISSYGLDLIACVNSDIKVVYFNEILGSQANMLDTLFADFQNRLQNSITYKSKLFTPAISIHSPYSTHPILAKKVLNIAKKSNYIVSTHFMESLAEREWLDSGSGKFKEFFSFINPNAKPMIKPIEYIKLFKEIKTLFTHVVEANQEELKEIQKIGTITHCPISNRLLGNNKLNIENIENITLATDGLSSNNSLSLWNELRVALFMHNSIDIDSLAKKLIKSVTIESAKALNLNNGVIKRDKDADLIVAPFENRLYKENSLATMMILHTQNVKELFVNGEKIS